MQFTDLSDDVIFEIIRYLDYRDVARLEIVSRGMKHFTRSNDVWYRLCQLNYVKLSEPKKGRVGARDYRRQFMHSSFLRYRTELRERISLRWITPISTDPHRLIYCQDNFRHLHVIASETPALFVLLACRRLAAGMHAFVQSQTRELLKLIGICFIANIIIPFIVSFLTRYGPFQEMHENAPLPLFSRTNETIFNTLIHAALLERKYVVLLLQLVFLIAAFVITTKMHIQKEQDMAQTDFMKPPPRPHRKAKRTIPLDVLEAQFVAARSAFAALMKFRVKELFPMHSPLPHVRDIIFCVLVHVMCRAVWVTLLLALLPWPLMLFIQVMQIGFMLFFGGAAVVLPVVAFAETPQFVLNFSVISGGLLTGVRMIGLVIGGAAVLIGYLQRFGAPLWWLDAWSLAELYWPVSLTPVADRIAERITLGLATITGVFTDLFPVWLSQALYTLLSAGTVVLTLGCAMFVLVRIFRQNLASVQTTCLPSAVVSMWFLGLMIVRGAVPLDWSWASAAQFGTGVYVMGAALGLVYGSVSGTRPWAAAVMWAVFPGGWLLLFSAVGLTPISNTFLSFVKVLHPAVGLFPPQVSGGVLTVTLLAQVIIGVAIGDQNVYWTNVLRPGADFLFSLLQLHLLLWYGVMTTIAVLLVLGIWATLTAPLADMNFFRRQLQVVFS